jgi:hypothetical protein
VHDRFVRVIEPGQVRLSDKTVLPVGPSYRAALQQKLA